MDIYYINSYSEKIILNRWPCMIQNEEELKAYEWQSEIREMGDHKEKILQFYMKLRKKKMELSIFAETKEELTETLNKMHRIFERDIAQNAPGRLFIGDMYIWCYCYSGQADEYEEDFYTADYEVGVMTAKPFWIKETSYTFKSADITSTSNKRYGYRYGYRYASGMKDTYILNEHFAPAQFRLRIYGSCVNPLIAIGGRIYTVHTILEDGEYLEVDSMAQTVIKTMMNGTKVNLFHYRGLDIFQRILPGKQVVSWDGKFDFDITLFKERSEPEW